MSNNLSELPILVQQEVRDTLKYYTGCSVTRWNGSFKVVAGSCLDNSAKPADFKVWDFKNTDVLTESEIAEGRKELDKIPESVWY